MQVSTLCTTRDFSNRLIREQQPSLELDWRAVAQRTMQSLPVVERFNVLEHLPARFVETSEALVVRQFLLSELKKLSITAMS